MNVLDLAMNHGLQPQKVSGSKGGEFASPCPFCGGKDRFRIWRDQNSGSGSYWCRQCGAHGDRIQFVMDTQRLGFKAACRITGDDAIAAEFKSDSEAPYSPRVPATQMQAPYVPATKPPVAALSASDVWREKSLKLVTWAGGQLPNSEGMRVLEKKGISAETAAAAGLGWIPEDIYRTRESWGLSTVIKEDTGKPKRLWIPQGIVIPHICPKTWNILRIRIRRPDGEPRYYVVPGSETGQMLLGTPGRSVLVVESELDAILMNQIAGDITSIIAMGTSHAKPDAPSTQIINDALCVLVALDFDTAGKTSFTWWKNTFTRSVRWPVPEGKDPSDAQHAGVDLRAWVVAGWPAGWRLSKTVAQPAAKLSQSSDGREWKSSYKEWFEKNHSSDAIERNSIEGKERDIHVSGEPAMASEPGRSNPIYELQALMAKNPRIKIIINNHRLTLQVPPDWQARNASIFGRISRLVYFDPTVFTHLHNHGAEMINCDNLN